MSALKKTKKNQIKGLESHKEYCDSVSCHSISGSQERSFKGRDIWVGAWIESKEAMLMGI